MSYPLIARGYPTKNFQEWQLICEKFLPQQIHYMVY